MKQDKLFKALQAISLGYSKGVVPADTLLAACDSYKKRSNFKDDLLYQMKVSKSLFDMLNGVPQDPEIVKAIAPGQTKMVDGIMYVYTATPNAKTQYDWRVMPKGGKQAVGRGSKITAQQAVAKQKFVNELFPKDLSTLKVVKQLGGSTGAKLVQDAQGNQYVMKRGTNTNNEHVDNEYLANQLYGVLGVRTPDYELYDDNGTSVLLSKYIPMCRDPKPSDYGEMVKGFMADVLLANWDVYQNDNCLIDPRGRVLRVDNGGTMDFKARGSKKGSSGWNDDASTTYRSMLKYNSGLQAYLTDDAIIAQVDDITAHKQDIINYLQQSGKGQLATLMGKRIDSLQKVKNDAEGRKALMSRKVVPRKLKTAKVMYRELDDKEKDDLWAGSKAGSTASAYDKLHHTENGIGWSMLADICHERGFDARPRMVSEQEFWKLQSNAKHPMMLRGLHNSGSIDEAKNIGSFGYEDTCFYGTQAAWGQGIYAHVNDGNSHATGQGDYRSQSIFRDARDYAQDGHGHGEIVKLLFEDDVRIVNYDDIPKLAAADPPNKSLMSPKFKALQKQKANIESEINDLNNKITTATVNIESDIKKRMHYDQASIDAFDTYNDNIDWGAKQLNGDPDIPSYKDFVEGEMTKLVKANGGDVKLEDGLATFTLPNSSEEYMVSDYEYSSPAAIKNRGNLIPVYNVQVTFFREWFDRAHTNRVERAINKAKDEAKSLVQKYKDDLNAKQQEFNDTVNKINSMKAKAKVNPDDSLDAALYDRIVNKNSDSERGIWAALHGYDVLIKNNGNHSGHSFAVILNRSKVICSQTYDRV